ncbi:MAG: hypothetical protein ACQEP3_00255 [Patescibacteria group bacterium]
MDAELSVEKIVSSGGADHIPLDHFKNLEGYSEEEIEEDKKTLNSAEKYFEKQKENLPEKEREKLEKSQKRGEAMEIVLSEMLDRWFETENIEVITQRTTKFDDIVNGTDIIIEFKTPDSVEKVALAIDASLNVTGMKDKLERCYEKMIGEREDFEVKYFQGQFTDKDGEYPHGSLKNVIPMAVGLGYKNANKLFDDFADYLSTREKDFNKGMDKINKLTNNSIKKIFLEQIENQLDLYIDHKDELKRGMVDKVEKISTIIKEVSKNMNSVVCDLGQKDDWILKETEKYLRNKRRDD